MKSRFEHAFAVFDTLNGEDPNRENGEPKELAWARRLSAWVDKLAPDAPEPLRLAARCQHLKRWTVGREEYPDGRRGYLDWRADRAKFHADEAEKVLREVGYDDDTLARVRFLNLKEDIAGDVDCQTLEDALCLEFLENGLEDFMDKHTDDEAMIVRVIRKSWKKMSEQGHEAALALPLSERAKSFVGRALG